MKMVMYLRYLYRLILKSVREVNTFQYQLKIHVVHLTYYDF